MPWKRPAWLTAGRSSEKAIEVGGHGIFTRHILDGLDGLADPDGSGLTASKLFVFVRDRVLAGSHSQQSPLLNRLEGEGEFLFLPPRKGDVT